MAKGRKTGGRQKGSKNKVSSLVRQASLAQLARAAPAGEGPEPVDVMLRIMRSAVDKMERAPTAKEQALFCQIALQAARDAAPYRHPRLSPVEAPREGDKAKVISHETPALAPDRWEKMAEAHRDLERRLAEEARLRQERRARQANSEDEAPQGGNGGWGNGSRH